MSSIGIEWPTERARVVKVLESYQSIGPAGAFGAANIEAVLKEADAAWADHLDTVRMVKAFAAMKGVA